MIIIQYSNNILRYFYANIFQAKEIAIQGKGTKMKSIPTGKAPQFAEICDHVKGIMDRGETISSTILARLIKFKLLMIKTKDQERRLEETKVSSSALLLQCSSWYASNH